MVNKNLIDTALGKAEPQLVLKNGKIINVFSGEILNGDIIVCDGYIAAVDYGIGDKGYGSAKVVDLGGRYVSPGFVNAHVHVESSMVAPPVYAKEEIRFGTTTLITDPHEIANVGGLSAVKNILDMTEGLPVNYYLMLPSCVPSTPFEHSGAVLDAEELIKLKNHSRVLGLGEMMNVPGVLSLDSGVADKLNAFSDKMIDGHSPSLGGRELQAYVSAGIKTDHESSSYEEAIEKLRAGMAVLVREGSAAKNLEEIISGVVKNKICTDNIAFCTDDKHLSNVAAQGTIRYNIKKSVALGLEPIKAIQMATINAARIYGLKDIGAVAPGYKADIVVFDSFEDMKIFDVYKSGVPFAQCVFKSETSVDNALLNSVNIKPLNKDSFDLPEKDSYAVIEIVEQQIVTKKMILSNDEVKKGLKNGGILKIAVIERHRATGNVGVGLIKGYGLKNGAVATTVGHDSHNIIVVGDNDSDMMLAVEQIKTCGGGYTVVSNGKIIDTLSLPFGGLMSFDDAESFVKKLDKIIESAYSLGINRNIDPFITLSFMALPVIPELRITDMGVFDVTQFTFI